MGGKPRKRPGPVVSGQRCWLTCPRNVTDEDRDELLQEALAEIAGNGAGYMQVTKSPAAFQHRLWVGWDDEHCALILTAKRDTKCLLTRRQRVQAIMAMIEGDSWGELRQREFYVWPSLPPNLCTALPIT